MSQWRGVDRSWSNPSQQQHSSNNHSYDYNRDSSDDSDDEKREIRGRPSSENNIIPQKYQCENDETQIRTVARGRSMNNSRSNHSFRYFVPKRVVSLEMMEPDAAMNNIESPSPTRNSRSTSFSRAAEALVGYDRQRVDVDVELDDENLSRTQDSPTSPTLTNHRLVVNQAEETEYLGQEARDMDRLTRGDQRGYHPEDIHDPAMKEVAFKTGYPNSDKYASSRCCMECDESLEARLTTQQVPSPKSTHIPAMVVDCSTITGTTDAAASLNLFGYSSTMVQCTIRRDRSSMHSKLFPSYELIVEETLSSASRTIAIAQKMSMNRTSNYHIFDMTRGQASSKLSKKSGNYVGKLRARNSSGMDYALVSARQEQDEIAVFSFDRFTLYKQMKEGNQPRKVRVLLPAVSESSFSATAPAARMMETHRYGVESLLDLLVKVHAGRQALPHDLVYCESKDPMYDSGNYRLNFNGRVIAASVKNFQVVRKEDTNDILCQFGKIREETYHLDFKAPFNAFQAFSLALAQFNI